MATFGFQGIEIDDLAERLSQLFDIRLYCQFSPLIGTWYSDIDIGAVVRALKEGKDAAVDGYPQKFELVLNDPAAPNHASGGDCILVVDTDARGRVEIEEKLRQSGLDFMLHRE